MSDKLASKSKLLKILSRERTLIIELVKQRNYSGQFQQGQTAQ